MGIQLFNPPPPAPQPPTSDGGFSDPSWQRHFSLLFSTLKPLPTTVSGVASGVATTIFTLPNLTPAVYFISCNIGFVGNAVAFGAFAIIYADGATARIMFVSNATLQTITLAGLAVQSTQTSGVANSLYTLVDRFGK